MNRHDQHIVNCLLFLVNWHEVPKEHVDLSWWKCGAVHCAGGWMTTWPDFQAMGIRANDAGAPCWARRSQSPVFVARISEHLFGRGDLFDEAHGCVFDPHYGRDTFDEDDPGPHHYDIVVERFERQIARLLMTGKERRRDNKLGWQGRAP